MLDEPWRADRWLARESREPQLLVVGLPWAPDSQGVATTPLTMRDHLRRFTTYHADTGIDLSEVAAGDAGNWPVHGLDLAGLRRHIEDRYDDVESVDLSLFIGGADQITHALVSTTPVAPKGLICLSSVPRELSGGLEEADLVTVGVHGFSGAPSDETTGAADSTIPISELERDGVASAIDRALSAVSGGSVHVSVDLDVLDPAFAPGCPDALPGGLDVRSLSEAVRRCAASSKTRSMDFVGVDATLDPTGRTLDVTAHLLLTAVAGYQERTSRPSQT